MNFLRVILGLLLFLLLCAPAGAEEGQGAASITVRQQRPRIFLRRQAWDGPSIEKIKQWLRLPEYQERWKEKVLTSELSMNCALRYILESDLEAGKQALDRFMVYRSGGSSPSYWGIKDQRMAALYDWLYDHPAFTDEMKKDRVAYLEKRAEANIWYLESVKENPFYSRFPGALAGLTVIALSIHGDSPKADRYLKFAYDCLREKMGTIRQAEDGSTGGSSYGYHHAFTDLANLVACWRSATNWDAARWIKEHQGNWLERQMLFQMWMTYPSGAFVKDGDGWGRDTIDNKQYRMSTDAVTSMYRNGFGRTAADMIHQRWGIQDYHSEYIWEFFVFNDPEIGPRPLSELGRAEVFSPELLGMVCWRSGWEPDATMVHFRAGEGVDTHCTWDQGKFIIYKQRPLAIKSGDYIGFNTPHHRYYSSPWSANCLLFTWKKEAQGKYQRGGRRYLPDPALGFPFFKYSHANPHWPKGLFCFQDWKKLRSKSTYWAGDERLQRLYATAEPMGRLLESDANERWARVRADLSHTRRRKDGSLWKLWDWERQLVFLGYKYLIVLDRVRPSMDFEHRWTLHTTHEPRIEDDLLVVDNGPARLFCRTLLPTDASLTKIGGTGHECDLNGENRLPPDWKAVEPENLGEDTQMGAWRTDVTPPDASGECLYLHVLFAADTGTETMPTCTLERRGTELLVKVGTLAYTFAR